MTDGFFCVKKSVMLAVFQEDLAYWRQERTTKKMATKKGERRTAKEPKRKKMRNRCMLEKISAGMALAAAVMAGVMVMPVDGHGPVVMAYAVDANNQNSQNISGGVPGAKMA